MIQRALALIEAIERDLAVLNDASDLDTPAAAVVTVRALFLHATVEEVLGQVPVASDYFVLRDRVEAATQAGLFTEEQARAFLAFNKFRNQDLCHGRTAGSPRRLQAVLRSALPALQAFLSAVSADPARQHPPRSGS